MSLYALYLLLLVMFLLQYLNNELVVLSKPMTQIREINGENKQKDTGAEIFNPSFLTGTPKVVRSV